MIEIKPRPALLNFALAAMWLALVVLVWLQFRWSAELAQAYEQRLNLGLANAAESLRMGFQSELAALCRAVQEGSPQFVPAGTATTLPHRLYVIDASFENVQRFDAELRRFEAVPWPEDWAGVREEMEVNAENLATASARRWFNRPWIASASLPAVFRAVSTSSSIDEDVTQPRFQGYLLVVLDLAALGERYFAQANERSFASGLIGSRVAVRFQDRPVFDSQPGVSGTAQGMLELDLFVPAKGGTRWIVRPAQDASAWTLTAEHRRGSLDEAVASLRMRNLATGLAVSFILLAGLLFLMLNVRRAEELARQQTDFVAGFSHELRTPITAIGMLAGNLREGLITDPEQVRRYGELILEQGNRLKTRIEDILGYAAGRKQPVVLQAVAVPELVEEVLKQEAPLLKGFAIDRRYDPDLPHALADVGVLRSCLSNLVSNAAKYARQGEWLGFDVAAVAGGTVAITVADRGPGIEATDQARIFEPFFRGSAARAGNIPGSGLGLHLVRTRIEAMGGKISVHSAPGEGTALTILLRSTSE